MGTIIWKNIAEALELVYPVLFGWADSWGYRMPSIEELMVCKFELYDKNKIGINNDALGTYFSAEKTISIAFNSRGKGEKLCTLVHELAHFIQHDNLGSNYRLFYDEQKALNGYWNNQYEIEARDAGAMMKIRLGSREVKRFNWALYRPEVMHFGKNKCYEFYIKEADWKEKKYFGKCSQYY
jgi:hypothetical protein